MTAWDTLVAPAQLAARLVAPPPADPACIVFDCRHQLQDPAYGRRVYAAGHVPGARFADVDHDLSGPVGPGTGRHPLPEPERFAAWLGAQGVSPRHQVVAYDDSQGAFAARLWWMLRQLGHRSVAVLDGGFARWTREGRPVTAQEREPPPEPQPVAYPGRPDSARIADLAEVIALSRSGGAVLAQGAVLVEGAGSAEGAVPVNGAVLVDARGGERYRGEQEPIDPRAGHIPGAIDLPYGENLNPDGTFLPPERLRERFRAALGGDPAASVHYCGSGVSACHNLLAMAVAGLPPGRLFPGSWSQWCADPARPIAVGAQPR